MPYWLMTIREYVRYTGDRAIVTELYPSVERVLAWFARFVDNDGLLNSPPHWIFVDWANVDKRGQSTALNAHFVRALQVSAELAEIYGLSPRAAALRTQAKEVAAAINRHLWDDVRGVYTDCRIDGVQSQRVSQQVNGFCLAYGIVPPDRQERVIAYITDSDRVTLTAAMPMLYEPPPFDEAHDVVMAQPFCAHHLHRGLALAGRGDLMLANIRERWGAMVKAGSTTIWELWSPMASQCHAWSTTPTFDLSTYVLGVTPLADGFARVQIAPQPVDLDWAEGTVSTPHGPIQTRWEQRTDEFQLTLDVPTVCGLHIALPCRANQITINGETAWVTGETGQTVAGLTPREATPGQVSLVGEHGGQFKIHVVKG
ncbi:MAG: alpha-L-rhamnosidase C-terminal domain-containing protein [Caldilineaceae bacterium]